MKLLKSKQNDFPDIYKEVPINSLDTKKPTTDFTELKKDIETQGLTWPIVLYPGQKVQVGNQRVEIAKQLGYNTISAYIPNNSDFGNRLQWQK
tara:strand:- start:269 stop:547 length:279 start_codon:yes stop_codon:yes gene_type:complete